MKLGKRLKAIGLIIAIIVTTTHLGSQVCKADEVSANEMPTTDVTMSPQLMRVTCYEATGNVTCMGNMPVMGITVGGHRKYLGAVCVIYSVDPETGGIGKHIMTGMVQDTGSAKRIQNGLSVDVYRDTLAQCYEWVKTYGDYCYVQIIYDGSVYQQFNG